MIQVIKRDGRVEKFDISKISNAILKAMRETEKGEDISTANKIANDISLIEKTLGVEEIQDLVEKKLMASSHKDAAKKYIIYRNERTKIRDRNNRLIQLVMDRVDASVDNRSNANVDEKSFSGREKEASSDIGKLIALEYDGLSKEVADAHKEMLVYQHDLEKAIYGIHNCLQLNFQEIFTYGFHTRNGDVRPPSNFSTACQLVAVAFQCQSQVRQCLV